MARDEEKEEMRKKILLMQEELERLGRPPYKAGSVVDIAEKTMRLSVDGAGVFEVELPSKDGLSKDFRKKLKKGSRVVVNTQTLAPVEYSEFTAAGTEIGTVDEVNNGRLRVQVDGKPRIIFHSLTDVKAGDEVLMDPSSLVAIERFERKKTKYALETIPEAPWKKIGGLEETITKIREEIEDPIAHREVFERYGRSPVRGILLYGPPGCGKTLIARSIAYNLAKISGNGAGHFINVKGPEILEKWVGNSEANIRRIYGAARETACETGVPTVVFIDEAESVMKTRGSGISTDVYDSIVPQFLAEMDGLEDNGNVITILATNREDIIDPAILRDGRVDRRIRVPRPNKKGAKEIFCIYLEGKPMQGITNSVSGFAGEITNQLYDNPKDVYRVLTGKGEEAGRFTTQNFMSGAMIKGVVDRACGYAIKREIQAGKKGISLDDLKQAADVELEAHAGFAQALVRDDWDQVFGSKGNRYYQAYKQGYLTLENVFAQSDERRSK